MEHLVEIESGVAGLQPAHPHNGYYAGDFSNVPFHEPDLRSLLAVKECTA